MVSQTTVHYKFITNVSSFTIVRSLKMTVNKSKRPKLLFKIIFRKEIVRRRARDIKLAARLITTNLET